MVVGVVLAAVSIGWADGSYNRLIAAFTRAYTGHIQLHKGDYLDYPSIYKNIDDYEAIGKKLMSIDGIDSWAPRLLAPALGSVGDKSAAVQVIGIDPELEKRATNFDGRVDKGRAFGKTPAHEVVVGKGLAKNLHAEIGDRMVIVSQAADGSIANDAYTIVGIASNDDEMADRTAVFMHLSDAQELFVLEGRVHEILVMAKNIKMVDRLVKNIEKRIDDPSISVLSWKQVNPSFYNAMQADRRGGDITYFIIMLIVAIGVLNTVLMAVLERTREFGVLKALGTKPSQIFGMIMLEVFFMSIIGIAIGETIGIALNYLLSIKGIYVGFSMDIGGIQMDRMFTEVNAKSIVVPSVLVFLSSVLVSFFPALRAARTVPAKTMRFH